MHASVLDEFFLSKPEGCILTGSTVSVESLCVENLLAELKSVAIEWKVFRNVKQCSCAMPFEPYNKKVRARQVSLTICFL